MATEVQCNTLGTFQDVPRSLHPLGFEVGDNIYLGCLCGAAILASGAALLSFAALGALKLVDENGDGMLGKEEIQGSCLKYIPVIKDSEAIDLAAVVRHPNTILLTVLLLYQGAAFSSLRLLIAHQDRAGNEVEPWMRSLGAIVALALLLFPIKLYRVIKDGLTAKERQDLPGKGPEVRARVRQWDDPDPPSRWVQYVLLSEHGDWVSCRRTLHWINQWQAAVRAYEAGDAAVSASLNVLAMWALGLANAFPTPTYRACGHVRVASATVHFFVLLYVAVRRPYRCLRDDILRVALQLLLIVALGWIAAEFYRTAVEVDDFNREGYVDTLPPGVSEPEADMSAPTAVLQAASVVVLVQVACGLLAEVMLLVKGWRAHSQTLEWAEEDQANNDASVSMVSMAWDCYTKDSPPATPVPALQTADLAESQQSAATDVSLLWAGSPVTPVSKTFTSGASGFVSPSVRLGRGRRLSAATPGRGGHLPAAAYETPRRRGSRCRSGLSSTFRPAGVVDLMPLQSSARVRGGPGSPGAQRVRQGSASPRAASPRRTGQPGNARAGALRGSSRSSLQLRTSFSRAPVAGSPTVEGRAHVYPGVHGRL